MGFLWRSRQAKAQSVRRKYAPIDGLAERGHAMCSWYARWQVVLPDRPFGGGFTNSASAHDPQAIS